MSKSKDEQADCIEKIVDWNPMRDDFANSQFNEYCSGPGAGADLDTVSQPSELGQQDQQKSAAGGGSGNTVPYLLLKNVPKEMTKRALHNLCSSYGKVTSVRCSTKNPFHFVDCYNISEMEAIFRGLEHNPYGIKVYIGKMQKANSEEKRVNGLTETVDLRRANQRAPNQRAIDQKYGDFIDIENRKYAASAKQHPRPHVPHVPIVSSDDYNSSSNLLQQNDPKRHFLIEDDAHRLERAGYATINISLSQDSKYKYRTGRAYIEMPEKTSKFIDGKSKESVGHLDESGEMYANKKGFDKTVTNCAPCSQCKRICDTVCARCSKYFCGVECQREAWPQHRRNCGKPEHLRTGPPSPDSSEKKTLSAAGKPVSVSVENLSSISDAVNTRTTSIDDTTQISNNGASVIPKMPCSGNLVLLTAISKSNVVFIRSMTYEDNLLFFKVTNALQYNAKSLAPLRVVPKCGQIVVTRFNDIFTRAMILNTKDLNKIKLIHIDYGNLDVKLFDELYVAPQHYCELPRMAIPVILKNVPDVFVTDKIRKFMYSYLDGIPLKLKYDPVTDFNKERGVHEVELIDESTTQSYNNVIALLAKPVEPPISKVVMLDDIKVELLPEGDNVELVVMDNSLLCTGCLSCTTVDYAIEIQKFQVEVQKYASSLPEQRYAPRVDEICLAKYSVDQKWYRGRCLDLVGDGHPTIVFFDYGTISYVNISDIRRCPPQFTFPVYTSDCEIEGLPEYCNEDLFSRLEELIPNGSRLKCDSLRRSKEEFFHFIKLKRIIEILETEGLLKKDSVCTEA